MGFTNICHIRASIICECTSVFTSRGWQDAIMRVMAGKHSFPSLEFRSMVTCSLRILRARQDMSSNERANGGGRRVGGEIDSCHEASLTIICPPPGRTSACHARRVRPIFCFTMDRRHQKPASYGTLQLMPMFRPIEERCPKRLRFDCERLYQCCNTQKFQINALYAYLSANSYLAQVQANKGGKLYKIHRIHVRNCVKWLASRVAVRAELSF
jgi:hypothetical protein